MRMTEAEWNAEGERRFGADRMKWQFVCPSCGHIAAVQDWKAAGAGSNCVAFSCIGRWYQNPSEAFQKDGGPCNYAGGGLIRLNPVTVTRKDNPDIDVFAFAPDVAGIVSGKAC